VVARPKTIYSNKKFAHAYPVRQGRHGRRYKIQILLGNKAGTEKERAPDDGDAAIGRHGFNPTG